MYDYDGLLYFILFYSILFYFIIFIYFLLNFTFISGFTESNRETIVLKGFKTLVIISKMIDKHVKLPRLPYTICIYYIYTT